MQLNIFTYRKSALNLFLVLKVFVLDSYALVVSGMHLIFINAKEEKAICAVRTKGAYIIKILQICFENIVS